MADLAVLRLAADVLAGALCTSRSDEDAAHCRLRVPDANRAMVRALLPLLTGVWVDERTGERGPRRDYIGRLPCGLLLVVETDAERVPLVDLIEGGGGHA